MWFCDGARAERKAFHKIIFLPDMVIMGKLITNFKYTVKTTYLINIYLFKIVCLKNAYVTTTSLKDLPE